MQAFGLKARGAMIADFWLQGRAEKTFRLGKVL